MCDDDELFHREQQHNTRVMYNRYMLVNVHRLSLFRAYLGLCVRHTAEQAR